MSCLTLPGRGRPAITARAELRSTAATSMVAEARAEPVVQISIGLATRDYLRGQR